MFHALPCHTQSGEPSCAGHRETPLVDGGCPRCLAGDPPVKETWFVKRLGRLWHMVDKRWRRPTCMLRSACGRHYCDGHIFVDASSVDRVRERVHARPDGDLCKRCLVVATKGQRQ